MGGKREGRGREERARTAFEALRVHVTKGLGDKVLSIEDGQVADCGGEGYGGGW